MLNFAFSLQQIVTSPVTQDRHSGVSVLPSDWLLVHQCSEVPANKHKANQPLIWLRLFSFCSRLHSNDDVDDSIKSQFWEKLCVYVKTVYLFVWSRANCNLQLCKTLLQLCNLQRRNTVNNNAPSDPHTHTLTPFLLCFPSLMSLTFLSWDEKGTCQEINASEISSDGHPLYLGRLGEFLLLWPAVQLVQNHSVRTFSRGRLAVSDGAATAGLGHL